MMTQPTIMTAVVMTIGISTPLVVPAKPTEGHTILPYLCKLFEANEEFPMSSLIYGFVPSLCPTFCHLIKNPAGWGWELGS